MSAEAADAAEDKAFGADRRGDEMPDTTRRYLPSGRQAGHATTHGSATKR
jgi:hypothetical protein